MDMIADLKSMHARQKAAAAKTDSSDKYGFPFEPFDSFSMEPLGFLETAMKLDVEAAETFSLLREFNRHSPLFYQMAGQLERLITQLGSACITKAVLEQQGENSPEMDQLLDSLTIDRLRRQTAFVFRKSYSSFTGSIGFLRFNKKALEISIRFSALDRRLTATAAKIEGIRSGRIKPDLSEKAKPAAAEAETARDTGSRPEETPSAPLAVNGRALPVDKNALRQAMAERARPDDEQGSSPVSLTPEPAGQAEEKSADPESVPGPEASAGISSPYADLPDVMAETADPDEYEDRSAYSPGSFGDDEDPPVISEEFVRRMSELCNDREFMKQVFPEYEFADSG